MLLNTISIQWTALTSLLDRLAERQAELWTITLATGTVYHS